MTRINLIDPAELNVKHLIAEYRELPRIFAKVRKLCDEGKTPEDIDRPTHYVLGKGHMKFFYTRLAFLVRRQQRLIDEMIRRGYKPTYTRPQELMKGINLRWYNDYFPRPVDIELSRQRIKEKTK